MIGFILDALSRVEAEISIMTVFKPNFLTYKVLILIIIIYISSLGKEHTHGDLIKSIPNDFLWFIGSEISY